MRQEYHLQVITDKDIGNDKFIRNFVYALALNKNKSLVPDNYDIGEPVRKKISKDGYDAAIDLWIKQEMPLMFTRINTPRYIMDIKWRKDKGKDNREFPWGCTVWLALNAGDKLAIELFRFLLDWFDPVFGFVTTSEDLERKHFMTYKSPIGQVEKYVGTDVTNVMPGIYWLTWIGNRLLERIDVNSLDQFHPHSIEIAEKGILIQAHSRSKDIGTESGNTKEDIIKSALGKCHFFDIEQAKSKSPL